MTQVGKVDILDDEIAAANRGADRLAKHAKGSWQLDLSRYPNGKLAWRPFIWAPAMPDGERYICELNGDGPLMEANGAVLEQASNLLAVLEELTQWGRDHTSPMDGDSPHEILVKATTVIAKARGVL